MDAFFSPHETRYAAAGLFFGVAVVLGILWGIMTLRKQQAGWPMFLVSLVGVLLWEVTALGLFWDGSPGPGALLTGIIAITLVAGVLTFLVNQHPWLTAVAFALLGLGALVAPADLRGLWIAGSLLFVLASLVVAVLLSGGWWAPLGYFVAAAALVAIGGLSALATSGGAAVLWRNITNVRAGSPWWLVLLALIPLTVVWSFHSLANLGVSRRWIALALRCSLILFLTLALAEVYLLHVNDTVTVLYLLDASESMPFEKDPVNPLRNLEQARHLAFINDAVAKRGNKHQRDASGLIVFGRYPRLELPPAAVPHFRIKELTSTVNGSYTDISAALKLALACFPEGSGKRVVLISDGNENLGKAEEQARVALQNNVQIDTVAVSQGNRNQSEILMVRIDAPPVTGAGTPMPIHLVVRSYFPQTVVARLTLIKRTLRLPNDPKGGQEVDYSDVPVGEELLVRLRLGLNDFYLEQPGLKEEESYVYRAKIVPLGVEKEPIDLKNPDFTKLDKEAVKADRERNNYAYATVLTRGEKKVLLIEPSSGEHDLLVRTLRKAKSSMKVGTITPAQLPQDPDKLNFFLGGFDCIILANVPRESFTNEQDAALRTCVHEQGVGLVMIGGKNSFGAGAWQNTEVEKALPVTCDLKSLKVEGRSGLVLIMHASEIAEGNMWQKKIAKLAIEKLSPIDMMGMLYFDFRNGDHRWHIPFQTVGEGKNKMLALVDSMEPGDMPDAEPSLKKAYDALTDPQHKLGTKHIIFISDGDHWKPPEELLSRIKMAKITVTTVCITSHGQGEYERMARVARLTGGREYPRADPQTGKFKPLSPNELPAIYMKETRLISQSFFHDKAFNPELLLREGPTKGLPDKLPLLYGFVRTTPRAGPLVQLPIMTPKIGDDKWPVLAGWQYGLGKAFAFTSDAQSIPPDVAGWDKDWAGSEMYAKFWEQLVTDALRELDKGTGLKMTSELRGGKVKITVEARDEENKPRADLEVIVRVTTPNPKAADAARPDIRLEQKNVGVYEAEVPAEDEGSYFLTALAFRPKRVTGPDGKLRTEREPVGMMRSAVTIPYSPELAEMDSNPALLKRLSDLTSGKAYRDDPDELTKLTASGDFYRAPPVQTRSLQNIWYWLLVLTGIGLFFDVAVRRIAVDPSEAAAMVRTRWELLRGIRAEEARVVMLDRLKSRKERVGESLEKEKAARRFEGGDAPVQAPPSALDAPQQGAKPPPRPGQAPRVAPDAPGAEPGDYASRLLKAKRRAMEDRDKDQK
jgi:uncharacterized membrane protein